MMLQRRAALAAQMGLSMQASRHTAARQGVSPAACRLACVRPASEPALLGRCGDPACVSSHHRTAPGTVPPPGTAAGPGDVQGQRGLRAEHPAPEGPARPLPRLHLHRAARHPGAHTQAQPAGVQRACGPRCICCLLGTGRRNHPHPTPAPPPNPPTLSCALPQGYAWFFFCYEATLHALAGPPQHRTKELVSVPSWAGPPGVLQGAPRF